jgi:hypothetical protein
LCLEGKRCRGAISAAWIPRLSVFLVSVVAATAGVVSAEGLSGSLEYTYNKARGDSEGSAGSKSSTENSSFLQRYRITFDRRLYPNLALHAGGLVERETGAGETDGIKTDMTKTTTSPTVELRLRTPLYTLGSSYTRREDKTGASGGSAAANVRETYSSDFLWKPDGFPDLRVSYLRTNSFDKDHLLSDTTDSLLQFASEYRPVNPLLLRYNGFVSETVNRVENIKTQETSHSGRMIYADKLIKGRVSAISDYRVTLSESEIIAGGTGDIPFPLSPAEGFSALDDTPEAGALESTPGLVDGNHEAITGINLGVVLPGGDARPRNLGLRFFPDVEVNTLFVVVDRELPPEIVNLFSWKIYRSTDDGQNWDLLQTVSPASFDSISRRFEIRFLNVTVRHVKVVVSPLSPSAPVALGFPDIRVTELQAVIRKPVESVRGKKEQTSHRYTLNIRARMFEIPLLTYEFSYNLAKSGTSPSIWNISNGLSASHRFGKVFSGAARISREDGQEGNVDRVAYLYTASLAANPLDTLRHSLVFSGRRESVEGKTSETTSVFLQNFAKLYQGVDLILGGGTTIRTSDTGQKTEGTIINVLLTLVPHRTTNINLSFRESRSTSSGGGLVAERTEAFKAGQASVNFTPLPALFLFSALTVEKPAAGDTKITQEYSVTFTPFPAGTLHLNFFYNEAIRSEDDARIRVVSPTLRWNITPRASWDMAYTKSTTDSPTQKSNGETMNGTLRIIF